MNTTARRPAWRRVRGDRVGEVAGGGAGHGREAERAGRRQRDRHDAVLERVRRVGAVVLDPQLAHAERGGEVLRLAQRRHAGAEADAGGLVLTGGQQAGVAPDALRTGLDRGAGDAAQLLEVVADLERREALVADVHRRQRRPRGRTRGRRGRGPGESAKAAGTVRAVVIAVSPHLPRADVGAGRKWHLARVRWLPGRRRAVSLVPLGMSGAVQLWRGPERTCRASTPPPGDRVAAAGLQPRAGVVRRGRPRRAASPGAAAAGWCRRVPARVRRPAGALWVCAALSDADRLAARAAGGRGAARRARCSTSTR